MKKKVITIIELLDRIANGKDIPTTIECDGCVYQWESLDSDYWSRDNEEHFLFGNFFNYSHYNLNKVVCIMDEYTSEEIEKIIDKLEEIKDNYEFGEDYDVIPTAIEMLNQYLDNR